MLILEKQIPMTFCGQQVYISKTNFAYLAQKRLKGIKDPKETFKGVVEVGIYTHHFRAGHFTLDNPTPLKHNGELEPLELKPFEDNLFSIMTNMLGKDISSIEDILLHWTCKEGKAYHLYLD